MITLAPYQVHAADWMAGALEPPPYNQRGGYVLADEPGVGKSYPALDVAVRRRGPCLIICPAYLIAQWAYYVEQYTGEIANVISGTQKQRAAAFKCIGQSAFTICSYNTVAQTGGEFKTAKHLETLLVRGRWTTVICDEAHHLRGRKTDTVKNLTKIRSPHTVLLLLTGTPIHTDAGNLWSLLHLCNPTEFRGYWTFIEQHTHVIENPWSRKAGPLKDPEGFKELIKPYVLARGLSSVGLNIDAPIEIPVPVLCDDKFATEHRHIKAYYTAQNNDGSIKLLHGAGAVMVGLRRHTSEHKGKLEALLKTLELLPAEPTIVFTWYRDTRDFLASKLVGQFKNKSLFCLHDSHTREQRDGIIERWKDCPSGILLGTQGSLGEGHNLQHASTVHFYEQDWTDASNKQAVARAVRRGQTRPVKVYRYFVQHTIDQHIHEAALARRELSEEVLIGLV